MSEVAFHPGRIVRALRFELGKVETSAIRERMVGILAMVDKDRAAKVATGLGLSLPAHVEPPMNRHLAGSGEQGHPHGIHQSDERGPPWDSGSGNAALMAALGPSHRMATGALSISGLNSRIPGRAKSRFHGYFAIS